MSNQKKPYDSTVARIAGNLLSGCAADWLPGNDGRMDVIERAVETARAIIEEVKRTEPTPSAGSPPS